MSTGQQRRKIIWYLVGMTLPLWLAVMPGWAGWDEGVRAYKSGDYAIALREWLPLAQQGNTNAQVNLGIMYRGGLGVPQDSSQTVQWFRRAAEQGDTGAQLRLADMAYKGDSMPEDHAQTAQWLRRAAEQGHGAPQLLLGMLYEEGDGVPQDFVQAAQWYRRAAEQGLTEAQRTLGLMYLKNRGVPQDFVQAYMWLNLAAARLPSGSSRDKIVEIRDLLVKDMIPAQLAEAQALARLWQPKPETSGMSRPIIRLGSENENQ